MFLKILRRSVRSLIVAHAVFGFLSAQAAPVITTESATQVGDLTATLNGTLNANSLFTERRIHPARHKCLLISQF